MRPVFHAGMDVDGFHLEEALHEGGMAMIWRVTRAGDPAPLALKTPLIRDSDDPTPIVGFEVEQMILPRLSGPHVPRFEAAGLFEGYPYVVMELIQGTSLKSRLEALPLAPDEVAGIGARVATALHDIHRQHVAHLDVKPSNVMLRETGEAVMVDFGLSRHDLLPDLLAEEFRLPFGTAPYMAPEQVLRDRNEPRSDLFALGVMLYYFLTGVRPFGIPHGRRALRRRLWQEPVPPRALRPDCPPWLQEIVLRCLEVEPERRHASAAQLAFDLGHPEAVVLTERAGRMNRAPLGATLRRWAKAIGAEPRPAGTRPVADALEQAPFVAVAVDLAPGSERLAETIRLAVRRILEIAPGSRLACLHVLKTSRVAVDLMEDAQGRNLHLQRLVELKAWAHPLKPLSARITHQVLEAPDPATALVDYARENHVDHIVMGARASSAVRRYLGSVSSQVVAEAPCSVTVVRVPEGGRSRFERGEEA
ncbi:serine/threonine protein kinase [Salinarimonas soli]|uniref:Protein kinase n=1 Tax=Salinarimonas soli TaxID=1638099 RepID=A0A5B2VT23_9HYPH|nr:bifunctional serine/threonine-protein kinase/universal stress protein [Salinarimonas soli]KAA2242155.1 protein kinase [Salinarimonas soli]